MIIRPLKTEDWQQVKAIYEEGIATGFATFETKCPEWEQWDAAHLKHSRLVAEVDGKVAGWVALSPVSSRCVYGGVGEVSVYVGKNWRGKGVGKVLLEKLIDESEKQDFWTIQSGIFSDNEASIKLHESVGFRKIGVRKKIGKLNGVWKDTILMEKRSEKVGVD
jgi:phosphinothricin acetyltransferase